MEDYYVRCAGHRLKVRSSGPLEAAKLFFRTITENNADVRYSAVTSVAKNPFDWTACHLIPTQYLLEDLGLRPEPLAAQ